MKPRVSGQTKGLMDAGEGISRDVLTLSIVSPAYNERYGKGRLSRALFQFASRLDDLRRSFYLNLFDIMLVVAQKPVGQRLQHELRTTDAEPSAR